MIAVMLKVIPKPGHTNNYFGDVTRLKSTRHQTVNSKPAPESK